MKLNLGCGQNKLPGYLNVDKYSACGPDRVVDLEALPWPFESNSAEEVVMRHVLEHLGRETDIFLGIMQELHRVLAPGGRLDIRVPHPRSDGFLGDPTHVRPINQAILSLFSRKNNIEWKKKGWPNTPLALYLDMDLEIVEVNMSLMPYWFHQYQSGSLPQQQLLQAIETHNNVVDELHFVLRKVEPVPAEN